MRLSQKPSRLLPLLLVVLSLSNTIEAGPYPKDNLHDIGFSFLMNRGCASYCGAQNQYCCEQGEGCFTTYPAAGPVAFCSATGGVAVAAVATGYVVYTTTYTETGLILRTSTYSSWYQVAPQTVTDAPPAICTPSLGQSSCGKICCASDQRCAGANSCTAYMSTYLGGGSYSAPLRPTSGGILTATSVVSATTTAPFQTAATATGSQFPIAQTGNNHGLSGGAIAGIVIGVIAGIILLLLICFCCIVKAGFDGLLAIFGLGKKKRRSTERIETVERYSRHGSGTGSRRETHTGWFGAGKPTRVDSSRKKKSGGFGGLGMVGAGLIGLAAVLGLKRKHDKKERPAGSDISSSYYTDSYTGTSASSASSDRRTRDTRRSRR